ncbi:hypothetical protein AYI70_g11802 [Smittium culicis]|uniref:Uncharacterized protein n=1 Tax=Smittium culicis TaxID=133412 RepID=A0A1R1X089_9FUNG|nr:hypothetical protein AYI70_g11802 [Smittium culicis]
MQIVNSLLNISKSDKDKSLPCTKAYLSTNSPIKAPLKPAPFKDPILRQKSFPKFKIFSEFSSSPNTPEPLPSSVLDHIISSLFLKNNPNNTVSIPNYTHLHPYILYKYLQLPLLYFNLLSLINTSPITSSFSSCSLTLPESFLFKKVHRHPLHNYPSFSNTSKFFSPMFSFSQNLDQNLPSTKPSKIVLNPPLPHNSTPGSNCSQYPHPQNPLPPFNTFIPTSDLFINFSTSLDNEQSPTPQPKINRNTPISLDNDPTPFDPNTPLTPKSDRISVGVSVKTAHNLLERFLDIEKPLVQSKMMDFFLLEGVISMLIRFITLVSPKRLSKSDLNPSLSWLDIRRMEHFSKSLRVSQLALKRAFNATSVLSSSNALSKKIVSNNLNHIIYGLFEIFSKNAKGSFHHFSKLFDHILFSHHLETIKIILFPPSPSYLASNKSFSASFGTYFDPNKPLIYYLLPFLSEIPIQNTFLKIFFTSWTTDRVNSLGMKTSDFIYVPKTSIDFFSKSYASSEISDNDKELIKKRFVSLRDSNFWLIVINLIENKDKRTSKSVAEFISTFIEDYSNFIGVDILYESFFNDDYLIRRLGQIIVSSPDLSHQSESTILVVSSLFSKTSCLHNRLIRSRQNILDIDPDISSSKVLVLTGIEARLELETFVPAFFSLLVGIHGEADLTSNSICARRLSNCNVSTSKNLDSIKRPYSQVGFDYTNNTALFISPVDNNPSFDDSRNKPELESLNLPNPSVSHYNNGNQARGSSSLFPPSPSLSPSSTLSASPLSNGIEEIESRLRSLELNNDLQSKELPTSSSQYKLLKLNNIPKLSASRINLLSIIVNILNEAEDLDEILGWVDLRVWDALTHWLLLHKSNQLYQSLFYKLISLVVQNSIYTHQQLFVDVDIPSMKMPKLGPSFCSCSKPPIKNCIGCFFRKNLTCNCDGILSYILESTKLVTKLIECLKSTEYYTESYGFFMLILNTFRLAIQSDRVFFRIYIMTDKVFRTLFNSKVFLNPQSFYYQVYLMIFGSRPLDKEFVSEECDEKEILSADSETNSVSPYPLFSSDNNQQDLTNHSSFSESISSSSSILAKSTAKPKSKSKSKSKQTVSCAHNQNKNATVTKTSLSKHKLATSNKKKLRSPPKTENLKPTEEYLDETCTTILADPCNDSADISITNNLKAGTNGDNSQDLDATDSCSDNEISLESIPRHPELLINCSIDSPGAQAPDQTPKDSTTNHDDSNALADITKADSLNQNISLNTELQDDYISSYSNKDTSDLIDRSSPSDDKLSFSNSPTPRDSTQNLDLEIITGHLSLNSAQSSFKSLSNKYYLHEFCADLPPIEGAELHLQKWQTFLLCSEVWLRNLTYIREESNKQTKAYEEGSTDELLYYRTCKTFKQRPLQYFTPINIDIPEKYDSVEIKTKRNLLRFNMALPNSKTAKPAYAQYNPEKDKFVTKSSHYFRHNYKNFHRNRGPGCFKIDRTEKSTFGKLNSKENIYDSSLFCLKYKNNIIPKIGLYNIISLCRILTPKFELDEDGIDYGSLYSFSLGFGLELLSNPKDSSKNPNTGNVPKKFRTKCNGKKQSLPTRKKSKNKTFSFSNHETSTSSNKKSLKLKSKVPHTCEKHGTTSKTNIKIDSPENTPSSSSASNSSDDNLISQANIKKYRQEMYEKFLYESSKFL